MRFIGVASRDDVDAIRGFVDDFGVQGFDHIIDEGGVVWERYGIFSQPAFGLHQRRRHRRDDRRRHGPRRVERSGRSAHIHLTRPGGRRSAQAERRHPADNERNPDHLGPLQRVGEKDAADQHAEHRERRQGHRADGGIEAE